MKLIARYRQQRQFRHLHRAGYRGPFATWAEAAASATGYDADIIFTRVRDALAKVRDGKAVYERDSVLMDRVEYSWPLAAALLRTAALDGRLSVLDFGGSLGTSYFQNRALLAGIPLEWSIVEQPRFVACGKAEFADAALGFYETVEAVLAARRPNVVVLSSVLQYLEDPSARVARLVAAGARTLVIDRTPLATTGPSRIYVQDVPSQIYPASYPLWVLAKAELLSMFGGYRPIAEFRSFCDPQQPLAHLGFILTATPAGTAA